MTTEKTELCATCGMARKQHFGPTEKCYEWADKTYTALKPPAPEVWRAAPYVGQDALCHAADRWEVLADGVLSKAKDIVDEEDALVMAASREMLAALNKALPVLCAIVAQKGLDPALLGYESGGWVATKAAREAIDKATKRTPDTGTYRVKRDL